MFCNIILLFDILFHLPQFKTVMCNKLRFRKRKEDLSETKKTSTVLLSIHNRTKTSLK